MVGLSGNGSLALILEVMLITPYISRAAPETNNETIGNT